MSYRTTSDSNVGGFLAIALILLWIAAGLGWILNIVKIFGAAAEPITAFFIIRVVGVLAAPVGAVLGYL